jgi:hypothetical protein
MALAGFSPQEVQRLRRAAFTAVQPLCVGLIQPGQDMLSTVQRLQALRAVMEGLPGVGKQACME